MRFAILFDGALDLKEVFLQVISEGLPVKGVGGQDENQRKCIVP